MVSRAWLYAFVVAGIVEQAGSFGNDYFRLRANESDGPDIDWLLSFRRLIYYEHRLPERGCFLLDAARVGEHEMASHHQVHKRGIADGIDERDVLKVV